MRCYEQLSLKMDGKVFLSENLSLICTCLPQYNPEIQCRDLRASISPVMKTNKQPLRFDRLHYRNEFFRITFVLQASVQRMHPVRL